MRRPSLRRRYKRPAPGDRAGGGIIIPPEHFDGNEVDVQEVSAAADLKDNAYVKPKRGNGALQATAGVPFAPEEPTWDAGEGGLPEIPGSDSELFFPCAGLVSDDQEVKTLLADFTKSMPGRDGN